MEILEKMLDIFAWGAVFILPALIILTSILQNKYEGSLEQKLDALNGYKTVYTKHNTKYLIIFIIVLVYLLAKYVF